MRNPFIILSLFIAASVFAQSAKTGAEKFWDKPHRSIAEKHTKRVITAGRKRKRRIYRRKTHGDVLHAKKIASASHSNVGEKLFRTDYHKRAEWIVEIGNTIIEIPTDPTTKLPCTAAYPETPARKQCNFSPPTKKTNDLTSCRHKCGGLRWMKTRSRTIFGKWIPTAFTASFDLKNRFPRHRKPWG